MEFSNKKIAEHLAEMSKFPTVSSVDPEKTRVQDFLDMHKYLETAFPLIHANLEKEIMGKCALVFHWKGSGASDRLPILLIAHQDVVPEGDWAKWKYPPFSGTIDEEGVLWSRGCSDCKSTMVYELEAVEALLGEGFTPAVDVWMAFGYNEEIMGGPGAACQIISDIFKERGIEFGIVLDEGGGGKKNPDGSWMSSITFAEKGYADYEFFVEQGGGHAAMPPKHNALGVLGKAMYDLEANPMDYYLSEPIAKMWKALAPYQEEPLKTYYADPEKYFDEICKLAETVPSINCFVRSTTTPTMATGSAQANILPERASIITNSRLLPGQTLEDLEAHFRKVLPEEVHFQLLKGHNPPRPSKTEGNEYELLVKLTQELYPGCTVLPSVSYGGTDSRFYCDNCPTEAVYRYTGSLASDKNGGVHAVNERIDTNVLKYGATFFARLIQEYK